MEYVVGIGEFEIKEEPCVLTCLGLGSCVGVALYTDNKFAMAHVMLPSSKEYSGKVEKSLEPLWKYADVSLPHIIGKLGDNIKAKIAGGAQMFATIDQKHSIGYHNVQAVKEILNEKGIDLISEDTGGNKGRTIRFETETKILKIKSINEEKEI